VASGKSAYLRNAVLNHVLGATVYTPPTTVYIALSTAPWSATATGTTIAASEPVAGGYSRVALANNTTTWPTTATGVKTNGVPVTFPSASANWGTIVSFYVVDASTAGNTLYGGDLYTARSVLAGDADRFVAEQLTVTET
jgi:hypothetical protein